MLLLLFILLFTRYRIETTLELTESITETCMVKLMESSQLKFSTVSTTGVKLWICCILDKDMENTIIVRQVGHTSFPFSSSIRI